MINTSQITERGIERSHRGLDQVIHEVEIVFVLLHYVANIQCIHMDSSKAVCHSNAGNRYVKWRRI